MNKIERAFIKLTNEKKLVWMPAYNLMETFYVTEYKKYNLHICEKCLTVMPIADFIVYEFSAKTYPILKDLYKIVNVVPPEIEQFLDELTKEY